ncbi:arylsulfatase [Salmonella enterica subsp. enterica serovar Urbana]|nr:arylsulfatase [Salmonella enterica]ECO5144612.1 arylsulfatase [Salmonella enterica]ECP2985866.1 arylsulfatase [Salmonella enterica]EDT0682389.1 arylsulfatase [Salmonella enterica subsp. enterica serovar Urbana]EDZ6954670.1 arylsulfatase [Salmonella enterica]
MTFSFCDGLFWGSGVQPQMDYICLQYPGYFRFAKWMERLAQGIADGAIEVPKDH